MSKYQCDLCDKDFKQKIDLDRHKSKKNACVPVNKVKEIKEENNKLKKQLEEKQKRDAMKSSLSNLFKSALNMLRDKEHLTGDKALRSIAYLLILRLSEVQIENGNIDIDNFEHYDTDAYEIDDINRYITYASFSKLNNEPEAGLVKKMENLRNIILSKHPKFRDLFQADDPFRINHDSTFKNLIKSFAEFPFEDYDADIQGEAYEEVIKDIMTGKVLGQFFTPPLIKQFMVELVDPKIKDDGKTETVYDPAMGTGGFLITAIRYMIEQAKEKKIELDYDFISKQGLGGREAEPDTFQLCKANMLISSGHTFETLERDDSIRNPIQNKYDIILTNPPFGIKGLTYNEIKTEGTIKKEDYIPIQSNSAIPLFLQAIIYILKVGGRCATVVPNGQELFNKNSNLVALREYIMKTCDLREIIHMPSGVFNNTDIKTCVFYFEKKKNPKGVLEVEVKGKKTNYKFIKEHSTNKVGFYEYDPFKKEKKLLVGVDIKDIEKNNYSLNYSEYVKDEEIKYDTDIKFINLENCCNINYGTRITRSNNIEGEYPVFGSGNETFTTNNFNRDGWNLLIGRFAVSEICTRIVNKKIFLNDSGLTIKPKDDNKLNYKFVGYYLHNYSSYIYNCCRGTAQKNLDMEQFKKIKIPIPPLETQKEIVEQLDFLYQAIETSEKKIEELKRINKIIMDNQKKYGENDFKKLGDIADINKENIKNNIEYINYIDISSVKEGKLLNLTKMESNFPSRAKRIVYKNDILYSSVRPNLKGYTFINEIIENCVASTGFAVIRSKTDVPKYIYYNLTTEYINDIITKQAKGAQYPAVNFDTFENLDLWVPPIDKQKEIVQKLEQNDEIIEKLQKEIVNNKQLAKEILDNIIKKKECDNNDDVNKNDDIIIKESDHNQENNEETIEVQSKSKKNKINVNDIIKKTLTEKLEIDKKFETVKKL